MAMMACPDLNIENWEDKGEDVCSFIIASWLQTTEQLDSIHASWPIQETSGLKKYYTNITILYDIHEEISEAIKSPKELKLIMEM